MKTTFLLSFCVLFIVSCKEKHDISEQTLSNNNSTTSAPTSLEGAWELTSFYNYIDNKVADSFKTNQGYRQVKLYTPTKVMWSKHVPNDSTEWFGYGNYRIEDENLIEVLDYGSEMMSKIIEEKKEFIYELNLQADKFSQIEIDENGNRIYSENYIRIE